MRKYLVIYEEAASHICLCNRSLLDFLIYEEKFFISVPGKISVENTSIRNETKGTHNMH
jgi:hypothetical protein